MAQPSVASYFNNRKRGASDDITKINQARKVLVLDPNPLNGLDQKTSTKIFSQIEDASTNIKEEKLLQNKLVTTKLTPKRQLLTPKPKTKLKAVSNNANIQTMLTNINNNKHIQVDEKTVLLPKEMTEAATPPQKFPTDLITPSAPTKKSNAMDKVTNNDNLTLKDIKMKLTRSSRLAELKASMKRLQEGSDKLQKIEEKTVKIPESPKLKSFRTIELEVQTSPQKVFSPEKAYLSPKKDLSARRNLFQVQSSPTKSLVVQPLLQSPSKVVLQETIKPALTLPFKYRTLAEIFRAIDTVVQIMFNRKESITFRKLKPAVEELLKRNLLEIHLAKIRSIYPDAFEFSQEKLKQFGNGLKSEQWELVITPNIDNPEQIMTPEVLLTRRRKLFNILLDRVKNYHEEFLRTLESPLLNIPKDKITRWHPEFDIERVPDIDEVALPKAPEEDKLKSGKDVLERARVLFNCNTRMEQALDRLRKAKEENVATATKVDASNEMPTSVLKGIPKALLEKVRQKQAAKALVTMTRSSEDEKQLQMYSRLPELARLTRNVFVSEKKSVLPLETVLEKLGNCYRGNLSRNDMETHLKELSIVMKTWLVFHNIRNSVYVKLQKNFDMSLVLTRLESLVKQKSELN